MNFWDYNIWHFIVQVGVLLAFVLIGNTVRRKVKFIRKSLLPTPVIGGILILIFKLTGLLEPLIDNNFMETITYHALGLGFIAVALKQQVKTDKEDQATGIFNTGILVVTTYLIQAVFGLGLTIVLGLTIYKTLFKASGLLLPLGFGQGPGQALNFGKIYEELGFTGGPGFGLSIAAIGFLVACLVGVIVLNVLVKKGKITRSTDERASFVTVEEVSTPNEIPFSEAVDKFTIQLAFVFVVYFITFIFLYGITYIIDLGYLGNFGTNTLKPLLWGFNFLIGTLFAVVAKMIMDKLKKKKLMNREYTNNFLLNRFSNFMFDIMIISGIAAINFETLSSLLVPLIILCVVGTLVTLVYLRFCCKRLFVGYEEEAFFSLFGMLTGTASTGMILLREVDPNYQTPAANNLVMQNFFAIVFGFPMLLMLTFAGKSDLNSYITFGVLIVYFAVLNVVLFRKQIFKKKVKE